MANGWKVKGFKFLGTPCNMTTKLFIKTTHLPTINFHVFWVSWAFTSSSPLSTECVVVSTSFLALSTSHRTMFKHPAGVGFTLWQGGPSCTVAVMYQLLTEPCNIAVTIYYMLSSLQGEDGALLLCAWAHLYSILYFSLNLLFLHTLEECLTFLLNTLLIST